MTNIDLKRKLSPQDMEIFKTEYETRKRSASLAFVLWFLLPFSIHRFYLRNWIKGLLFMASKGLLVLAWLNVAISGRFHPEDAMLVTVVSLIVLWECLDIFRIGRLTQHANELIENDILRKIVHL